MGRRTTSQPSTWEGLKVIHPHAAGPDLSSAEFWAALPPDSTAEERKYHAYPARELKSGSCSSSRILRMGSGSAPSAAFGSLRSSHCPAVSSSTPLRSPLPDSCCELPSAGAAANKMLQLTGLASRLLGAELRTGRSGR
jgi:hypothetical protein